jgi:hypothetical protein
VPGIPDELERVGGPTAHGDGEGASLTLSGAGVRHRITRVTLESTRRAKGVGRSAAKFHVKEEGAGGYLR